MLVSAIGQLQESAACIQSGLATVEADYAAALAAIPTGAAKTRGVEVGPGGRRRHRQSAEPRTDRIRRWATRPTRKERSPASIGSRRGCPSRFAPGWGNVTPFVLESSARSSAPVRRIKVGSRKYAGDFNEVKSLGGDDVTTPSARTPEQTEIGLFWIESSPLAWNRIARSVSVRAHLTPHENARLFGLLNMAMADGYIGSWEGKYHYNFWRPVTAIQLADTDGNPDDGRRSELDARCS